MNVRNALSALVVIVGIVTVLVISNAARRDGSVVQAAQVTPTQTQAPTVTIEPEHTATLTPRAGIGIGWHPFLEQKSDADLARDAELVVVGIVGEPEPSRWNTPDGKLPPGTTVQNIAHPRVTYTDRLVSVETVLKGTAGDSVRVRTLGGTVGQDSVAVENIALFVVGQRVLLFLTSDDFYAKDYGPEHYTVVGEMQGLFRVEDDEATRIDRALPLADLLATVEANK